MGLDMPSISYMALYVLSVHLVNSNSRTSTHWKLNRDSGKVENVVAMAAAGDAGIVPTDDPLLNLLTSRVASSDGEWKLESPSSSCFDSCRSSSPSKTEKTNSSRSNQTAATIKESQKSEKRRSKSALDCGKPVSKSVVDDLRSITNRNNYPHIPEPEVAIIFRSKGSNEVDMNQLEQQLKSAKKERPKSSQVYNQIGNFWRIKGDTQRSIECFRRALALVPNNSDVLVNLARVLFNQHEYDDALELTRRSLDSHTPEQNMWLQHFTIGEIHLAQGRRRDAAQHFRHTLELHPDFPPAMAHIQELETDMKNSNTFGGFNVGSAAVTYYTLFIILLLVLGVLCGVLLSVDTGFEDSDSASGGKTQRHFNRAMAMRSIKLGINPKLIRMRKQYGC